MSLPYYKRYPRDFIEGTIGMSLELKGAYSLVLDLIYMQDGRLPDDARYISGLLGCTVKKWNSIRAALIGQHKIYVSGEFLANFRADKERETLGKFQENQAEKARKSNKINGMPQATAKPARDYTEPEPDKDACATDARATGSALVQRLVASLGPLSWCGNKHHGLHVLSDPLSWLSGGCDLDLDILPAITAKAHRMAERGDEPRSWRIFADDVFRARDRRLAPSPPVQQRAASPPANRNRGVASMAFEMAQQLRERG